MTGYCCGASALASSISCCKNAARAIPNHPNIRTKPIKILGMIFFPSLGLNKLDVDAAAGRFYDCSIALVIQVKPKQALGFVHGNDGVITDS